MSKKIVGEDGKTYVEKKPFYKRIWFIALAIIVIIAIASSMNGDTSTATNSSDDKSTTAQSNKKEDSNVPTEHKAALKKAESYANNMDMSKAAVYDQLVSDYGEKFPEDAAQYAMANLKADWKQNALDKAKSYQEDMAMSVDAIRDQLVSEHGEKFTQEEADYAIQNLGE